MEHIIEARRYVDNAKTILKEKAIHDGEHYRDKKYVRLAGHAAYTGVLVALDGLFEYKGKKRKSKEWYIDQLAQRNKKMVQLFEDAYYWLHLVMGYDGVRNVKMSKDGLKMAEQMIGWAEKNSPN
jgi:Domain of unknown function (DUF5618)